MRLLVCIFIAWCVVAGITEYSNYILERTGASSVLQGTAILVADKQCRLFNSECRSYWYHDGYLFQTLTPPDLPIEAVFRPLLFFACLIVSLFIYLTCTP